MVGWGADGVRPARSRDLTGVLALAVVADSSTGTVTVSKTLVRRAALARGVCHGAGGTLALVGTHCVDAHGCRCTWAVLAFINIHTAVVGENVSGFTGTLGLMV